MVSRQETAAAAADARRGDAAAADDALVLVSGLPPIRAKKLRYYKRPQLHRPDRAAAGPPRRALSRLPAQPRRRLGRPGAAVLTAGLAAEADDDLEAGAEGGCSRTPSLSLFDDLRRAPGH